MIGVGFLRKFSQTFYKDKSASDTAQVPADSVSVNVYRQGSTSAQTVTILTTGTNVQVRSIGHLLVDDIVQSATDSTKTAQVVSITDNQHIRLASVTGSSWLLISGVRLVIQTIPPTLYSESSAAAFITNPATTNSRGYVEFFTPETLFDIIVSGTGLTTTLYTDQQGGWILGGAQWINAKDYSTIQAAVDAVTTDPTYGANNTVVYVPAGDYTSTTTPAYTTVVLPNNCILKGDGRNATRLLRAAGDNTTHLVSHTGTGGIRIEGMTIEGTGTSGAGVGFYCVSSTNLSKVVLTDVYFNNTSSWAMQFGATTSFAEQVKLDHVHAENAKSGGSLYLAGPGNNAVTCVACQFNGPGFSTYGADSLTRGAVHINGGWALNFIGCSFQPQDNGTCLSIDNTTQDVYGVTCEGCHFEGGSQIANNNYWYITTQRTIWNLVLRSCTFLRGPSLGNPRLLKTGPTTGYLQFCAIRDCFFHHNEAAPSTDDIVLGNANDNLIIENLVMRNQTAGTFREVSISASRPWLSYIYGHHPYPQIMLPEIDTTAVTDPRSGAIAFDSTADMYKVYEVSAWKTVKTFRRGTDIASAATITIPKDGDIFHVTGSTNITNGITVNTWDNGRSVCLVFDSTPTISATGTSKLAGNFTATADDTLALWCDGTNWYETSRSVN